MERAPENKGTWKALTPRCKYNTAERADMTYTELDVRVACLRDLWTPLGLITAKLSMAQGRENDQTVDGLSVRPLICKDGKAMSEVAEDDWI